MAWCGQSSRSTSTTCRTTGMHTTSNAFNHSKLSFHPELVRYGTTTITYTTDPRLKTRVIRPWLSSRPASIRSLNSSFCLNLLGSCLCRAETRIPSIHTQFRRPKVTPFALYLPSTAHCHTAIIRLDPLHSFWAGRSSIQAR